MLRVLAECKASVRTSPQGLDSFAADGARAVEDLDDLVRQLGDLGLGNEWQVQHVELLNASKSYIKGDFKVTLFVTETLALRRDINCSMVKRMKSFSQIRKWQMIATGLLPVYMHMLTYWHHFFCCLHLVMTK